ncbi:MAG: protein kinase [Methylacidiphilales bacterium]|nr:protein kinase [Candidatus Methylacidiphilales bacterium]
MRDVLPFNTLLQNGNYRIDYPLGRGGFGITYQAIHSSLKKIVAIKEFYPQEHALRNSSNGELIVPTTKQEIYQRGIDRFLCEGQTLAKLNHPNVVRVENFFRERGTAYLVMELITGDTLHEELEKQPNRRFYPAQIEKIMSALVGALTEVHLQGIYHLDLKPENVLVTPEGRLVLVDFGASRQGLGSGTISQAFTLNYAPLEVISGRDFGAASDIFELGMMIHEMLTGRLPPSALDRLSGNEWNPQGFVEPWQYLLASALNLYKDARSQDVKLWWEGRIVKQQELITHQINTTQNCLACGTANLITNKFCQNCGTTLQPVITPSKISKSSLDVNSDINSIKLEKTNENDNNSENKQVNSLDKSSNNPENIESSSR